VATSLSPSAKATLDALPDFLSVKQMASTGICSEKMARAAMARGDLPAFKVGKLAPGTLKDTRPIRAAKSDFIEWLAPVGCGR